MCRADCGQWWPVKLCVQPEHPKSVSAPRGALWAAMSGTMGYGVNSAPGAVWLALAGGSEKPNKQQALSASPVSVSCNPTSLHYHLLTKD
jgi:hypothetical protein